MSFPGATSQFRSTGALIPKVLQSLFWRGCRIGVSGAMTNITTDLSISSIWYCYDLHIYDIYIIIYIYVTYGIYIIQLKKSLPLKRKFKRLSWTMSPNARRRTFSPSTRWPTVKSSECEANLLRRVSNFQSKRIHGRWIMLHLYLSHYFALMCAKVQVNTWVSPYRISGESMWGSVAADRSSTCAWMSLVMHGPWQLAVMMGTMPLGLQIAW